MANNELSAEAKILEAANSIFLLYGYHATILQQIATEADVNTAAIHYYFRTKERLYHKVVENVLELILNTDSLVITNQERLKKLGWFLFTELYNNKERFEKTVKELYPDNYDKKISEIKKWLEFAAIP
ncbi:MAG: TetR family transcriptional regulator [Bacteroidota bacterium]|nr:hypothetical protein [Odoribacter sp.]MDP3645118.1 TetR family transcriptional regulator [Bacteroidota bacterium]